MGEMGRPQVYSDHAILAVLMIRTVYHLPLRALEGFLKSLMQLLRLDLPVPSYTQICRRARKLKRALDRLSKRSPTDLVFDSTGLKVYGEGEWKVRQHGASQRRMWKKLHLGVDPFTGEIILSELTDNKQADGKVAERLMERAPNGVERVYGDGAYDGAAFRKVVYAKGAVVIVPPPRDAVVHLDAEEPHVRERNEGVLQIMGLGGDDLARKIWKKLKGYHTRSLVETAMYRFKQLTGERLKSRRWENQCSEADIKCLVINKMTKLGMPRGYWEEVA